MPVSMGENIINDNGTSLNDSGGCVTVLSLGSASNERSESSVFKKSKISFLHFWDF
jgi:hypothetical protein